jgi:hypothetical protein
MAVEFKNADVAAKYSTIRSTDPKIHLPGKGNTGWAGKLSDITIEAADKLFLDKRQNLVQLKQAAGEKQTVKTELNKKELG